MDPFLPSAVAANLSSEAAKGIFPEINRHIRYVRIYKENVKKFEEKHKILVAKRTSLQQEVDAALRNVERIKADVELWCQTVDQKMEEEEKKVKELEDKAKKKCFIGLCPNIKSRYRLSRKAEEDVTAFDELIRQCQFNGSVGYRDVAKAIVGAHSKDFEAFESRQKVFNDVMEALKDDTNSMIGIYGAGGVGKTTLVNEVANKVKLVKLFDLVVNVAVTQNPDIQKIQDEIAESLGLYLQEKSTRARADRLRERLMLEKKKKNLIVLDNVWKKLDLEEVGIPTEDVPNLSNKIKMQLKTDQNFPSNETTAAEHNWCKILLTSRDQDVLSNEMVVKTTFAVGVLEENEAWDLFKKRAGDVVESSEVQSIAIKVARKCAGLPLAIATVARALRNKPLFAWEDALEKLQTPSPTNFTGISAEAYSAIELSYNHLESDELKQTFLLCGLLGGDATFEYLLRYCMGLGLFHDVNTVEKTRNRLLTVVSKLKASCLLNDSYSSERVSMHDLICDVAIAIASRDNHVFALGPDDVLEDWPDAETLKICHSISLRWARINRFPDGDELNCPQLTFFYMGGNESSVEIPTNFLLKMENLKVLDLTSMHFSSLPSINLLKKIRTLCLDHCLSVGDISIVGEMGSLEILSLMNSNIEMLPEKIGHLIKLKILDLSGCSKLKLIPPGVLSGLSRLVELYMGNSFVQWEAEGDADQRSNASLAEFKNLSCLTTLHAEIPSPKLVPRDLSFRNLQRYKICIGQAWDGFDKSEHSRALKLKLNASTDSLVDGVRILLKKAETLCLDDVKDFKFVWNPMLGDRGSFPHLKDLDIQNGLEIQYILDGNDAADKTEFLRLQSLTLVNLPKLISLCPGRKRGASTSIPQLEELPLFNEQIVFPCLEDLQVISVNVARLWHNQIFCIEKLKSLIVKDCGNLKHLFSSSMARSLVHLEDFEITGCKSLTEIISTEDIEEESYVGILFPQLCTLTLMDLQHLIRFCSESHRIEFPSLFSLEIEECPKLKGLVDKSDTEETQRFSTQALFNEKVMCPNLETLNLSSLNVQRIWPDDQLPQMCSYVQNLTNLSVVSCHGLKYLFSSSMMKHLLHLQNLTIEDCRNIEEVIFIEDGLADADNMSQMFLSLEYLQFKDLPKLMRFCHGSYFEFPLMRELELISCPQFKTFISDSLVTDETHISEKAEGNNSDIDFPSIFNEKVAFPQLAQLVIIAMGNCRKIWKDQLVGDSFCKLNILWVAGCDRLLNIFPLNMRDRLQNLEILNIGKSDSLEDIFEPPVTASESTINFLFPQLTKLGLAGPRNLKRFYRGRHTTEFPSLKEMLVLECDTVEIFASQSLNFGESSNIQPLFWVNQGTFPNLENLTLSWNEIRNEIWPSSVSFKNLTILEVSQCHVFVNLMACSTAKSLVQLSRLSVIECVSLEEIISGVGDEVECGVVFTHLKCLELIDLPRLASFCGGDYSFEFPSLEKVIVRGCPKMEIFSRGYLSTPMLRSVQFLDSEDEACWEDDLNTTIQRLFTEQVGYRGSVKDLVLSEDSNKLTELWKRNLQADVDFKDLQIETN